jgi:hypothetical protein
LKPPAPVLRQFLRRIETKPKPVHIVQFQDFARIGKIPKLRAELDEIIESIERGDGVPEAFYRFGIDQDEDPLLANRGIMHLHLGGKYSDILVFLIQYPDRVVLLETNTHVHFRTQPAGKNIVALTQSWFQTLENDMAAAAARAAAAATDAERKEAEEIREKRAASIAAFKAKAGWISEAPSTTSPAPRTHPARPLTPPSATPASPAPPASSPPAQSRKSQ